MEFLKKLDNEDKLLIGAAVLSGGVLAYFYWRKKKLEREAAANTQEEIITTPVITIPQTATPGFNPTPSVSSVLNKNVVLKKGSKGNEVRELQKKLGVDADGDFGSLTEAALFKVKGVKSISLNAFDGKIATPSPKKPTIKPDTPLKVGQRVMVNVRTGFTAQRVFQKADGSYYTDGTNIDTGLNYGEEIGKIKSVLTRPDGLVRYIVERKIFKPTPQLLWIAHKNVKAFK